MRSAGKVCVLLKSGNVSKLEWADADSLVQNNKAAFISQNLYRFARLGGDISKMATKRPDDATLKAKIAELRSKKTNKKSKKTEDDE